jgi:NADPH:quinone reductase-like Zn-dependent oxidoreductase
MKAWRVVRHGEPREVLTLTDVPDPEPGPAQLVVRVLTSPANYPDVLMCRGEYQVRPDLPFTPGIELCGEVVERAPASTDTGLDCAPARPCWSTPRPVESVVRQSSSAKRPAPR